MDEVEDEEKGPVWEAAPATSKAPAVAALHASAKAGAPSSWSAPCSSSAPLPPPLLANVWVCFFPKWCLELRERLLPLYKGRFLNKMNLGSIYSTCFFGAVVIRGMNSNYKPKAFLNRRNLVSTCFFRAVVTAVKGDVEYIQSSFSPPKQFQGLVGWNCTNLFFAPFPNELEALSVIATLIRLKRFHAGN